MSYKQQGLQTTPPNNSHSPDCRCDTPGHLRLLHLPTPDCEMGAVGLSRDWDGAMSISGTINNAAVKALNAVPEAEDKIEASGQKAVDAYQNVQVLKDIDSNELLRQMTAFAKWVAPEQGCSYCHKDGANFAEDALYTKVVARRMIQMTRHLNADWKQHVAVKGAGVTCYTCHRGNPVPKNVWYTPVPPRSSVALLGNKAGQNRRSPEVGLTSLPYDPFTPFLEGDQQIRVMGPTALPDNEPHVSQAG